MTVRKRTNPSPSRPSRFFQVDKWGETRSCVRINNKYQLFPGSTPSARFPWRRFPLVCCWCRLFLLYGCGTVNFPPFLSAEWTPAIHSWFCTRELWGFISPFAWWNLTARGFWFTHPHPAKPIKQTNQKPVQYSGSQKSAGFPGYRSGAPESRPFRCPEARRQIKSSSLV